MTVWNDNAARFATTIAQRHRADENNTIRANLAYAANTRHQFPHVRAQVMAEAITNLVLHTHWRAR